MINLYIGYLDALEKVAQRRDLLNDIVRGTTARKAMRTVKLTTGAVGAGVGAFAGAKHSAHKAIRANKKADPAAKPKSVGRAALKGAVGGAVVGGAAGAAGGGYAYGKLRKNIKDVAVSDKWKDTMKEILRKKDARDRGE